MAINATMAAKMGITNTAKLSFGNDQMKLSTPPTVWAFEKKEYHAKSLMARSERLEAKASHTHVRKPRNSATPDVTPTVAIKAWSSRKSQALPGTSESDMDRTADTAIEITCSVQMMTRERATRRIGYVSDV